MAFSDIAIVNVDARPAAGATYFTQSNAKLTANHVLINTDSASLVADLTWETTSGSVIFTQTGMKNVQAMTLYFGIPE